MGFRPLAGWLVRRVGCRGAAGLVSLELGSDIAGSLRAPAHFCGVCAHKPSYGIVPLRGHTWPRSQALDAEGDGYLAVGGPLARSAVDLALALDVLAGPDEEEAASVRAQAASRSAR